MTIVHKDENIHKNRDRLSRCPLHNNISNPGYVPEEASPPITIEGISVTELNTTFFEEVRKSYTHDINCSILCQLLTRDCKDNSLTHALDEIWKKSYDEGVTGALLNEEGLELSEKTYLWRAQNKYSIDKSNEIRQINS
ncbi:hypothetical protein O181_094321 [Austropuccinia psidii MF-1]|uniref:Uncharacterized protein n=1 Tax=Austropuccinia psidii MF-1 TaxID=1389203 RepID=A0A9Q3J313_9BASI|nr:hypothetical protein [Austropuccinia psidii MF-1]